MRNGNAQRNAHSAMRSAMRKNNVRTNEYTLHFLNLTLLHHLDKLPSIFAVARVKAEYSQMFPVRNMNMEIIDTEEIVKGEMENKMKLKVEKKKEYRNRTAHENKKK